MGNVKGTDHCDIGNHLIIPHSQFSSIISRWFKTHLTGCIAKIMGYHRYLTDTENPHIHQYLMRKWGISPNNKKRSHTQLDSRKQVIAFQDRVITINIKEAQHPLK